MTGIPKTTRDVRGAGFWAWTVSIALHVVVLTVFSLLRFSQAETAGAVRAVPTARIGRITELTRSGVVAPKPKIRQTPVVTGRSGRSPRRSIPVGDVFAGAGSGAQDWQDTELSWAGAPASEDLASSGSSLSGQIEFFGSTTRQRKVCYLVDCSGSMLGVFERVRKELAESISQLQPDQYFYVIFFGQGKLSELGDGRLVRATAKAKSAAHRLLDKVQPAGRTNALNAIDRALQVRDAKGASPSVIYFLTDGFELTGRDASELSERIACLLEQHAPTTKVNTIGFWPQDDDRKMLETIARQSGGECVIISGREAER